MLCCKPLWMEAGSLCSKLCSLQRRWSGDQMTRSGSLWAEVLALPKKENVFRNEAKGAAWGTDLNFRPPHYQAEHLSVAFSLVSSMRVLDFYPYWVLFYLRWSCSSGEGIEIWRASLIGFGLLVILNVRYNCGEYSFPRENLFLISLLLSGCSIYFSVRIVHWTFHSMRTPFIYVRNLSLPFFYYNHRGGPVPQLYLEQFRCEPLQRSISCNYLPYFDYIVSPFIIYKNFRMKYGWAQISS